MVRGRKFGLFLVLSLLANALCLPPDTAFRNRRDLDDNQVNSKDLSEFDKDVELSKNKDNSDDFNTFTFDDDDDDFDDDFDTSYNSGGGSNIFSLLNIASALLPSLSGNSNVKKNNEFVNKIIRDVIKRYQTRTIQKRQDVGDNVIDIDYATELKPPFYQRQESQENDSDDSDSSSGSESVEDNGAEESVEKASDENGASNSKQDSASNGDSNGSEDDEDYDEPPGGDGQGGGILGLLAGLSGDGESDLGSLLAAVGGIVANLSGDGVDINALIATGLGLFVGLLSDENTNPGEVIASYLLTSLDTITGGGAQNNGAFFGKFLSKLVKGTSAGQNSNQSPTVQSTFGNLKMDILRAMLQFATSMIGLASSGSTTASSPS